MFWNSPKTGLFIELPGFEVVKFPRMPDLFEKVSKQYFPFFNQKYEFTHYKNSLVEFVVEHTIRFELIPRVKHCVIT